MKRTWYFPMALVFSLSLSAQDISPQDIIRRINEGRQFLDRGDFEKAEKQFQSALFMVEAKANEKVNLQKRLGAMIQSAKKMKQESDRHLQALRREQSMRLAYDDLKRRDRLHKAKIDYFTKEIESHLKREDYASAARLSKNVLSMEPANPRLKHYLQYASHEAERKERRRVTKSKREASRKTKIAMDADYILQTEVMSFPDDFAKKTRRREEVKVPPEAEWKTNLKRRMDREVKFDFENIPFNDLMKHLQAVYEVPIIVDTEVLEEVFADGTAPIDLRSTGMSLETALKWVVDPFGLKVGYKNGAVYIAEAKDLVGDKNTLVYDVRDLAHVPSDYIAPEISLAGGEEASGGIVIQVAESEYTDTTDPEQLVELIESVIQSYEAQFK